MFLNSFVALLVSYHRDINDMKIQELIQLVVTVEQSYAIHERSVVEIAKL